MTTIIEHADKLDFLNRNERVSDLVTIERWAALLLAEEELEQNDSVKEVTAS